MNNEKEIYYSVNSDNLINWLIENKYIARLGVGSRFDEADKGMHASELKADNTYNWELTAEGDNGEKEFYSLSNNFEIRETNDILILSKHIGEDIRGGYEDDIIYLKLGNYENPFYCMVVDGMHKNKILENN